jgi:sugar (pentulose or hexulose) kinase
VHLERRYEPDAKLAAAYASRYALYRDLYPTLKSLLHQL